MQIPKPVESILRTILHVTVFILVMILLFALVPQYDPAELDETLSPQLVSHPGGPQIPDIVKPSQWVADAE